MLETAALVVVLVLVVLLVAAWLLEDIAAKVTRVVDSFLVPAAERFGEVGVAWQRLVAARALAAPSPSPRALRAWRHALRTWVAS